MIQAILILLMLALGAMVFLSRSNPGKFNIPIGIVLLLTVVALVLKVTVFRVTEVRMTKRYAAAVAYVIGQKVAEENPQRVLVIQYPDYSSTFKGRQESQLAGFRKGLGNESIDVVTFIPEHPPTLSNEDGDDDPISNWYENNRWRKEFQEWYPQQGKFDALVSLVGMPNLRSKKLIDAFPPIYIRQLGRIPAKELAIAEAGKLKGYAHLRPDIKSDHEVSPNASLEKVFEARYRWVDL